MSAPRIRADNVGFRVECPEQRTKLPPHPAFETAVAISAGLVLAEPPKAAGAYDFPIDLTNLNSVPAQLARHVPSGSRVLDIGCASGNFSSFLIRERNCTVVGLEKDPDAAAAARANGLSVHEVDLEAISIREELRGARFDRIILADVLEHLTRPEQVLAEAAAMLRPRGQLLVSIPNISHIDVVLALVHDRWEYRDSGLLDRTHIHFFTESSFRQLAGSVGLVIRGLHRLTLPPLHTELWPPNAPRPAPLGLTELEAFTRRANPNCEVYQFVFRLTPHGRLARALRGTLQRSSS